MSKSPQPQPPSEESPNSFTYWAFLAYSHQDKKWADWLHRKLETYRVPRRLVGREGRNGPIPSGLFPVFRDVDELPTSSSLSESIATALQQSRYLVVICSPQSARSRWVNEEILTYKRLGRSDRLVCFIVDGEPNASDKPQLGLEECFPQALQFDIGPDGQLTSRRVEPIAADVRFGSYVKYDAMLKIIAGILGIRFSELKLRDRIRRRNSRLALMLLLVVTIGLGGWFVLNLKNRVDSVQELERRVQNLPFPHMSGKYTQDEKELLKARQGALLTLYQIVHTRSMEVGTLTVDVPKAAFELQLAQAELAWAEGDLITAHSRLVDAVAEAEEYLRFCLESCDRLGLRNNSEPALTAEKAHADAMLALVRMRRVLNMTNASPVHIPKPRPFRGDLPPVHAPQVPAPLLLPIPPQPYSALFDPQMPPRAPKAKANMLGCTSEWYEARIARCSTVF